MTHAHKIFIRSKKEDSGFIYHVLEAHEGLAAYSTLDFDSRDPFRDLELWVPLEQLDRVMEVLLDLKEIVTILPGNPSKA